MSGEWAGDGGVVVVPGRQAMGGRRVAGRRMLGDVYDDEMAGPLGRWPGEVDVVLVMR